MMLFVGAVLAVLVVILIAVLLTYQNQHYPSFHLNFRSLEGKTIIVTGAEQGKGTVIALELAKRKGRVIMLCADRSKGELVRDKIVQMTGNTNVVFRHIDMSMMSSVREFVSSFKVAEKKLDILINNREICTLKKSMTKEGLELIFAENYFGPFLLTILLLDLLKKSHGRVVNVGSLMLKSSRVDCENLRAERGFHYRRFYKSKLALLMFTKELARRSQNSGVVACYVHLGLVPMERYQVWCWISLFVKSILSGSDIQSPKEDAHSVLFYALDDSIQTGGIYQTCVPGDYSKWVPACAYNKEVAIKLWETSERITANSDVIGQLRAQLKKRT